MPAGSNEKIVFVLSPDKVVRETNKFHGECLACGAKGMLLNKLGTLWEKGHEYLFKDVLVHEYWCPMNKVLFNRTRR